MDFHHLKYFVEVADQKSFSKAARNLHISQSAISRTIKALEDELGVVLFIRNAKSVELTDGGTIFLTHSKRVVFMFEHLKTDFENEFRLEQGSIRIGIPPITDAPIFAHLLGEFKKAYPQINLELFEQGSKKVEISAQEGLIDIGIICTKANAKEFDSFYLTSDPLAVILPKSNPLAQKKELRLEDLSDQSFVLHKDDFNLHDEIIKACKQAGFVPNIVFETSQRDLMLQTVGAELAIAILPSRLCPNMTEHTNITSSVVVRPLVPEIVHTLYVIWKKGHYLSHAARLWLDFVQSKLPLPGFQSEGK
ncbi:MAG: LysR family transcriptional regulator [Veillonella sp.]|nr:LysR family transcriptional regulator [Veillonella sp.]MCF0155787.1 LysR family transcriptional regulator [Veillonella sp.]